MKQPLLASALALVLPAHMALADNSSAPAQMSSIVVSVSRDEATLAEIPQSTTILTRQEIENSPAQTMDQLLRNVPGVNLSSVPETSKDPTGQSLGMRGLGNVTVLVLLDGIPIMDPFYGTVQWYKVPKSNVDHVEIVRGGSVVWGNMAVGGVVNIISKKASDNSGTVSATYGTYGSTDLALSKNFLINDAVSLNLSIDQLYSAGYQLTPAAYLWRYPDKQPITTRDSNIGLTAYLHPSSDLQGFIRLGYHENNEGISYQYGENKQTSPDFAASLTKTLSPQSSLTTNIWAQEDSFDKYNGASCYWKSTGGCYSISSTATSLPAAQANDAIDQYYTQHGDQGYHEVGFSSVYSRTLGSAWHDIQLGFDYRRLSANDNESIYNSPTVFNVPTGSLAASVVGSGTQSYEGLFMQTRFNPLEALQITLAAREDHFSSEIESTEGSNPQLNGGTSESRFDPSVSARYFINDDLSLRGSVNQTFRGPGLNNTLRSYGSATSTPSIANPFLVPQDMLEREIGVDYEHGALSLSATYFLYSITNAILSTSSVASGAPTAYQEQLCHNFSSATCNFYNNAGDEKSQGVELIGSYRLSPSLRFNASFTMTDAILTSSTTSTPTDVQLAGIPRLTGNAGVNWTPIGQLELEAMAHYFGRMNYSSSSTTGTYSQGSSTTVDLSARYHFNHSIDLTLSIDNLLNRTYTDSTWTYNQPYGQTVAPPRMAYAGVQAKF